MSKCECCGLTDQRSRFEFASLMPFTYGEIARICVECARDLEREGLAVPVAVMLQTVQS